ncbi:probable aspartic proteinase GIP2 [Nymphaea colorata]|uniref:probable aspartic proteinase GIP2 n=1 Tax=Nymphaea colorata TaxID=210225 RepID=UPI00129E7B4D|nr:probable aspartic proteinase GIP2 [Nymphaea colorata]
MAPGFAAMELFFHFLILFCLAAAAASPPKALVLPVTKDASTRLYVTTLQHKTPLLPDKFVVDIGSAYLWVYCDEGYRSTTYRSAPCRSSTCTFARARDCNLVCMEPQPRPGCTNNTCTGMVGNTVAALEHMFTYGLLADDVLALRSTDGRRVGPLVTVPHFLFICGPLILLQGLPSGSAGMFGLGQWEVSPPKQLASRFGLKKKFAICLSPSTTSPGAIFFGDGPYVLLPGADVSKPLAYTKLLNNPVAISHGSYSTIEPTIEYFVKLTSIMVNGKAVPVNATLLELRNGNGGTKISTVDTHTWLESSIYAALEAAFLKEATAMGIARVASPANWPPFRACFSSKNVTSTRLGWAVPEIELQFQGASFGWKIYGSNSMVDMGNGVMCLGFLDAAGTANTASVVIGGYQLENHLLEFDLEQSTMGFGSTLLLRQTTCANFNFSSA